MLHSDELPWYMVIGNPAAGKSSAIYNSGLKFPFEETHQKSVSAGLSGTRHCDWFFSTEGVLLCILQVVIPFMRKIILSG